MTEIVYLYFKRVNDVNWFVFTVDNEQNSAMFVYDNEEIKGLLHHLRNGLEGEFQFDNGSDSVYIPLILNKALFYGVDEEPMQRFIRRLAKPQATYR
jgi:hypothetical protein